MKALNNALMFLIATVVLLSLVGVSVKQVKGVSSYSLFIKTEPSVQVFYPEIK